MVIIEWLLEELGDHLWRRGGGGTRRMLGPAADTARVELHSIGDRRTKARIVVGLGVVSTVVAVGVTIFRPADGNALTAPVAQVAAGLAILWLVSVFVVVAADQRLVVDVDGIQVGTFLGERSYQWTHIEAFEPIPLGHVAVLVPGQAPYLMSTFGMKADQLAQLLQERRDRIVARARAARAPGGSGTSQARG